MRLLPRTVPARATAAAAVLCHLLVLAAVLGPLPSPDIRLPFLSPSRIASSPSRTHIRRRLGQVAPSTVPVPPSPTMADVVPTGGSLEVLPDGSRWVLILSYLREATTTPQHLLRDWQQGFPFADTRPLGTDGSLTNATWGHVRQQALNQLGVSRSLRFWAISSCHNRTIHFKTTDPNIWYHVSNSTLKTPLKDYDLNLPWYQNMPDHTALYIPQNAPNHFGLQGDTALTNHPVFLTAVAHWNVGDASGTRWEVDDAFTDCSTHHRVWLSLDSFESASVPESAPAPASEPATASPSSSTPIGAIVGGIVGGVVVLAGMAFLMLRRRKKRTGAAASTSSKIDPEAGTLQIDTFINYTGKPLSAKDETGLSETSGSAPARSRSDALAPQSVAASVAWRAPMPPSDNSQTVRRRSISTDRLLSYITNSLDTHPRSPAFSASSSSAQLSPDMMQWIVHWNDIRLERTIGRGSCGRVYYAHWRQTPVAAKVLISTETMEQEPASLELPAPAMMQLQQEASVMSCMRHPNIVNFVGLVALPPCILTEYCHKGSLYTVLSTAAKDPARAAELTWERRVNMALEGARGILYLHSMNPPIIHRDIKSPNLLVDKAFTIKVSDFNLSKLLAPATSASSFTQGADNPIWQAPEILEGGKATTASDVYAFGLVMYELLTWELPWKGIGNAFKVANVVMRGTRPDVPALDALRGPDRPTAAAYEAYCQLMRDCWVPQPGSRPHMDEVVARLSAVAELE